MHEIVAYTFLNIEEKIHQGCHPWKIYEIFDAKSRVWGQFGPENKLIEGQPNKYDVICRNASMLAGPVANDILHDICRSAVPAAIYLPERRSRTTTPLLLSMLLITFRLIPTSFNNVVL